MFRLLFIVKFRLTPDTRQIEGLFWFVRAGVCQMFVGGGESVQEGGGGPRQTLPLSLEHCNAAES